VELLLSGDYKVKEGGLGDEFKAVRLDFHWGPTDRTGSEHRINGTTFPLEVAILLDCLLDCLKFRLVQLRS
jgi:hypothetical protein